jgi:putative transposase
VYEKGKNYFFSGRRVRRGLYKTNNNLLINADVNGAANIMKKAILQLFGEKEFRTGSVQIFHPQTLVV